jgi:hypothetical protein
MKRDTGGIHFHQSIWASAMSGLSGTSLSWWWDVIDRQDLYGHYGPLASFMKGARLEGSTPARATSSDPAVQLSGLQTADRARIWLLDGEAGWHDQVVENKTPRERRDVQVTIEGLSPGLYDVDWWDTGDGTTARIETMVGPDTRLQVRAPVFRQDIAVRVIRKP